MALSDLADVSLTSTSTLTPRWATVGIATFRFWGSFHLLEIWTMIRDHGFLLLPSRVVITSGCGVATTPLNAFDNALMDARVANLNLLRTSSIVPGGAQILRADDLPVELGLPAGTVVPAVYSFVVDDSPGQTISACLALGLPPDQTSGVIFEFAGRGSLATIKPRVDSMLTEAMQARGKTVTRVWYAEHELIVPSKGFGCVVSLAILLG